MNKEITAAIMRDTEYDSVRHVTRRRWIVALSLGPNRRRYTSSRREAIEWCDEHNIAYVIAPPTLTSRD